MSKVDEMRTVLALMDELKPHVKKGVKDDTLYAICARYICTESKTEKPAEIVGNVQQ